MTVLTASVEKICGEAILWRPLNLLSIINETIIKSDFICYNKKYFDIFSF
jgi:hypothetical protein